MRSPYSEPEDCTIEDVELLPAQPACTIAEVGSLAAQPIADAESLTAQDCTTLAVESLTRQVQRISLFDKSVEEKPSRPGPY